MAAEPLDRSVADDSMPSLGRSGMPRALVLLLGMAAVFITAQGIQPVRSTLAAAFMALNLVIVVWPVQRLLARFIPRILASIVAGIAAIALLAAMIWAIGGTIARLIRELPKYYGQFSGMINQLNDLANQYDLRSNPIVSNMLNQVTSVNLGTVLSTLGQVASGLSGAIGLMVMILIILVFMTLDSMGITARLQRVSDRHNPAVSWALYSFARGTRKYWVVTTIFGLAVATCNWVLLLALGVPLALTWAMFSFVTNYIPNVGFIIGLVPPVLMALLANSPWTALWVVVGYCVFNFVLQTLVQPKVSGDVVGITPTVAILSLLIWAYVLGPLGAILAIPATLLMKSLFVDIDPETRWLNAFIASNPTTSTQDPIRLSTLLDRARRIKALSALMHKPGVTPEEAEAAHRELATLTAEAQSDPGTVEEIQEIEQIVGPPKVNPPA